MSKFEKAINEYSYNYNERCKKGDNNFYFLNCYGEELEKDYEVPNGVRVIMFCYSGKILNVCNVFEKFNWSNILLNPNSFTDYYKFLLAISENKNINDYFRVYEEGDIIKNINLYSNNNFKEGIFKLPVKGFCYNKNSDSIVISSNTPTSSIVNYPKLKYFFREKQKKIIIDDNKIIDLMKKNKDVCIVENYFRKIYKNVKLSNLINSMRINGNFTILLTVCREGESSLITNGRKIEDELEKIKRRIFIKKMLSK